MTTARLCLITCPFVHRAFYTILTAFHSFACEQKTQSWFQLQWKVFRFFAFFHIFTTRFCGLRLVIWSRKKNRATFFCTLSIILSFRTVAKSNASFTDFFFRFCWLKWFRISKIITALRPFCTALIFIVNFYVTMKMLVVTEMSIMLLLFTRRLIYIQMNTITFVVLMGSYKLKTTNSSESL